MKDKKWKHGLDYKCGTGHGVSFFLNVHEGPQGLRQSGNKVPLELGMVITNEPGVYKEGKHGIRIENTLLVVKDELNENGQFYRFNTISYCPIDLNGVNVKMLNKEERLWLNRYHRNVYERLSPYLNKEEKALKYLTIMKQEINRSLNIISDFVEYNKIKIDTIDERLTTVAAHKTMNFLDVNKHKKRNRIISVSFQSKYLFFQ